LQLQTAMDNQLRLENAIETQNAQIEKQIADKKASDARIELLTVSSNRANEKVDELREKFARHDLNMLSLRKPKLIEKVVNRGTARVFKELEELTTAKQTVLVESDEESEG